MALRHLWIDTRRLDGTRSAASPLTQRTRESTTCRNTALDLRIVASWRFVYRIAGHVKKAAKEVRTTGLPFAWPNGSFFMRGPQESGGDRRRRYDD